MKSRGVLIAGLALMLLGVMTGAFGAHALKHMVSDRFLDIWKTAAHYQMIHALGLIGLAIHIQQNTLNQWLKVSGICLLSGVFVFSGSLYLMVMLSLPKLGMLTPIGGLLFIAGWISWLVSAIKN